MLLQSHVQPVSCRDVAALSPKRQPDFSIACAAERVLHTRLGHHEVLQLQVVLSGRLERMSYQVDSREFGNLFAAMAIKDPKEACFGCVQIQHYAMCIFLQGHHPVTLCLCICVGKASGSCSCVCQTHGHGSAMLVLALI